MTRTTTPRCHCQDPIVFGHHCHQPCWPTYRPGETFTVLTSHFTTLETFVQAATQATWNWAELDPTPGFTVKFRETPRN